MRNWILFVFMLDNRLERLCGILDRRIERRAVNLVLPAEKLIDEIYRLNDLKMRLINLRVLHRHISTNLSSGEMAEISKGICARTQGVKAAYGSTPKTTAYRRRNKVLDKCIALAEGLGFSEEVFERDYPRYKKIIDKIFK